ncbi:alpha/beta fold hydrolase [Calothrix rhizosoleniae]|uniref:alpha/beta fold hydrolase n=1 Tax=Calothrix rhizosoleniae TaxID=888997 RepID=UPI000B4A3908|nr:alpha/beta hydrolase [Calothrix rhizosoleniae]
MPKIQANGIEVFYNISGTGEPLLLLAGFACDNSYWSLMMPHLTKKYQVIRVDNRGVGRSSTPTQPYSIKEIARDVAVLLEHLCIDSISVIGHSMGGQIAQELALNDPTKVQNLILISSWAQANSIFHTIIESWGDLPQILDWQQYQKIILPWVFTDKFLSTPLAIAQILQMAINYPFRPTPQGLYDQSRAILNTDTSDRISEISCPTLVMVGKQDILTPVAFSQQLAQLIPYAEIALIENCGHGLLIESPHAVAEKILGFLANMSA